MHSFSLWTCILQQVENVKMGENILIMTLKTRHCRTTFPSWQLSYSRRVIRYEVICCCSDFKLSLVLIGRRMKNKTSFFCRFGELITIQVQVYKFVRSTLEEYFFCPFDTIFYNVFKLPIILIHLFFSGSFLIYRVCLV